MPKRWVVGGIWVVLMSAGIWTPDRNAAAEQPTKPQKVLISDVIIGGDHHRMSSEQIKARLRTRPGREYNPNVVDEDVRELYKTGQFSHITALVQPDGVLDREGDAEFKDIEIKVNEANTGSLIFGVGSHTAKIYFNVREMPNMVQKVTFLGAKHIKPGELKNITNVRDCTPLNPNLNRQGCQKILEKYAEQGRSFADCQLLKGGDWADTEVVYQITEGPKYKVSDIQLKGNTFASVARLRHKIPLQVGDTYHRKTAEAGINHLCTFYRDFGYRDVRISLEIKRDSAPGEITMIYHVHEGPRYRNADDSQK